MVVIKTEMQELPKYCDGCSWYYGSRPHPYKGWTDMCELTGHCMDDDQPEEWIYDGNGRPAACPLIEVSDWIPVEDMLPEEGFTVLVTRITDSNARYLRLATYQGDCWMDNSDEYGKPNPHPVIAWMPVRDVYRQEEVIKNETEDVD